MQSLLIAALLLTSYIAPLAPLSRHDVAIGGDASTTLVAWTDVGDGTARIHVSDGKKNVVLPMHGRLQLAPVIGFDSVNFLVVWQEIDERQRTTTYAQRMSTTGAFVDASPIALGVSIDPPPPRVVWSSGVYRVTVGKAVINMNAAAVFSTAASLDTALDLAVADEKTVFTRFVPGFCSGFSMIHCTPSQSLLTFEPGGNVQLPARAAWIEASDGVAIWSDGVALYVAREGGTRQIAAHAKNAAIAGSFVVYENDERLYAIDVDAGTSTRLTDEGSISPALLARGDGRYTLLYRTTTRPAALKTLELGVQPPARRRTF